MSKEKDLQKRIDELEKVNKELSTNYRNLEIDFEEIDKDELIEQGREEQREITKKKTAKLSKISESFKKNKIEGNEFVKGLITNSLEGVEIDEKGHFGKAVKIATGEEYYTLDVLVGKTARHFRKKGDVEEDEINPDFKMFNGKKIDMRGINAHKEAIGK